MKGGESATERRGGWPASEVQDAKELCGSEKDPTTRRIRAVLKEGIGIQDVFMGSTGWKYRNLH